jgi:hypothetical protein
MEAEDEAFLRRTAGPTWEGTGGVVEASVAGESDGDRRLLMSMMSSSEIACGKPQEMGGRERKEREVRLHQTREA